MDFEQLQAEEGDNFLIKFILNTDKKKDKGDGMDPALPQTKNHNSSLYLQA